MLRPSPSRPSGLGVGGRVWRCIEKLADVVGIALALGDGDHTRDELCSAGPSQTAVGSTRAGDPIERTPVMRKLIVSTFLTLDGVMQAPGGPGEDDSGGFAHGGWSVNYWDEQMGQIMDEATSTPFAMVLGRKTYDIMAAYWPHAPEEAGAKTFNDATKYVASRSHPRLEWSNSVLIEGDAAEGIAALKKEDGPELQAHGSGNLIQTLLRHKPCRRVPPVGLPPPHRIGQTPVLGRHHPRRAEACRQHDLHHWSSDRYVRASRRDRHRIVRAGLTALGATHRAVSPQSTFVSETHH